MTTNSILFNDYIKEYLKAKEEVFSESTNRTYRSLFNNHIRPFFKDTCIDSLNRRQLQHFIDTLKTSINMVIAFLKTILKELYIDELIDRDFASMLKRPPKVPLVLKRKQALTQEQIKDFFTALQGTKREYLIRLMFATGIRIGEALALQWSDFLWSTKGITISITKTFDEHSKLIHSPKTTFSNRKVYLTEPYTMELLRTHYENLTIKDDSEFIAHSLKDTHQPITRATIKEALKNASRKVNLPFIVTPHHARVNYASYSLAKGISEKNLQEQLGHSNTILIHTVYGKPIGARLNQLMEHCSLYD